MDLKNVDNKRKKKRAYILSVFIISTMVAFLFVALVDQIPSLLRPVLSRRSKVNITDNKELLKVLRASIDLSKKDHSEFSKIAMLPYKPQDKYYVSSEMYEQNMRFLSENGYNTLTLSEFAKKVRHGQKMSSKAVLLYSDTKSSWFYNIAFPILKKYKFTTTIGVQTDLVNTPGHMSITQLAELQDYGIEISSHSVTHPDLTTVSESQLRQEVVLSKEVLEKLGLDVKTFIYPYGAYNDRVVQAVKDAGYIGARAVGGPYLSNGGGYASYNKALLFEIKAGLPVNTTTFDEFKKYVLNDHIEVEAISSVHNDAGNNANIGRIMGDEKGDLKNDSFASIALPDVGDAIKLTIDVPQSGEYNLDFKVQTGSNASGSTASTHENAYKYIIDGRECTVENGSAKTTGPYENESTSIGIVWGHQCIDNISFQKGENDIIVVAVEQWAILDYLCIDAIDGAQRISPQITPSINYDGIFDEAETINEDAVQTGVFLAIHGYDHQNPRSGSFADEFDGLSYNEVLERVKKSREIFNEANLNPTIFIPPGGKAEEALFNAAAKYKLNILDYTPFEGTWLWRNMTSFDDPRFAKASRELKKGSQPEF